MLNYDNDTDRRITEFCTRTGKALLNPIADWTLDDVWEFIGNDPYCCLYDEGFERLGCIGCPMGRKKRILREFERWPQYRKLYLKTFEKLILARKESGLPCQWETADDVMRWWLGEDEQREAVSWDE